MKPLRLTQVVRVEGDYTILENLGKIANGLWNAALYKTNERKDRCGKYHFYSDLCSLMREHVLYRLLPSQSAQAVLQKVDGALRSYISLRKKDGRAKPPGYHPKETAWVVPFKYQQIFHSEGQLVLPMSMGYRKEKGIKRLVLNIPRSRREGKIKYLELFERDGLWFAAIVQEIDGSSGIQTDGDLFIDLGIVNLAAIWDGERTVLYKGGEVSSALRYRNKDMARRQTVLATHGKRSSKGKRRLCRRLTAQAYHAIHALTRDIVTKAKIMGRGVVVGDLKGLRWKNKVDDSANQKVHQWQFGKIVSLLGYKCREAGVPFAIVDEKSTSSTCSMCGKEEGGRIKRGLYRCGRYGKAFNADCNGAVNHEKRYLQVPLSEGSGIGVVGSLASPVVVHWDRHAWRPMGEAKL